MTKRYKTEAMAAIHESMQGLHRIGAIDDARMKRFDATCLAGERAPSPGKSERAATRALSCIVYKDDRKVWRWHLRAANGRNIAASGEGYKSKKDCLAAIALVKVAHTAAVVA